MSLRFVCLLGVAATAWQHSECGSCIDQDSAGSFVRFTQVSDDRLGNAFFADDGGFRHRSLFESESCDMKSEPDRFEFPQVIAAERRAANHAVLINDGFILAIRNSATREAHLYRSAVNVSHWLDCACARPWRQGLGVLVSRSGNRESGKLDLEKLLWRA